MLSRVTLNFRTCRGLRLDLEQEPLVVLVGRNAAGKSTILEGIYTLAGIASKGSPVVSSLVASSVDEANASFQFDVDERSYQYDCGISLVDKAKPVRGGKWPEGVFDVSMTERLRVTAHGNSSYLFERNQESLSVVGRAEPIRIAPLSPAFAALQALLPDSDESVAQITEARRFLSRIKYYPIYESLDPNLEYPTPNVVHSERYADWLSHRKESAPSLNEVPMRLLELYLERREVFNELSELLGSSGLGIIEKILVRSLPIDAEKRVYLISFVQQNVRDVPFEKLSQGTRRVLLILMSVLSEDTSVMLLEHPEDAIHSGLLLKVIDILKKYAGPPQLIVTSHSSEVFNCVAPEDVRLVSMEEGETRLRQLSPVEIGAAKQYISREGALSDFLKSIDESE